MGTGRCPAGAPSALPGHLPSHRARKGTPSRWVGFASGTQESPQTCDSRASLYRESRPACRAMWHPLVLMLLLFPAVSIPSATAAPIPDARSQDSLQIVLQGAQAGGNRAPWAFPNRVPHSGCPPGL
ncbi:uncharacterized protein RBAK isoform X3 [Canis lupus familiaris]|uniref:uncharacterized protein LOC112646343 isoform X4 n=1 Tax=Canis lupus dingo TaxID=286419 RepID=UPI0015F1B7FA|nr:uncharacterized protein LOC112646343 isoform X4 [Canis lupus dingo]XP_038395473.1 uncharacterized protein RBAK isoform X3 [Canis lupus familiaris]XP_038398149.1 uncharacterized protein RBAK isoform X3 [Canis lupus familiaris]XP_038524257.1 uncharacterized protein RBAK isoform X3 [Canis lupus familiaris]